MKNGLLSYFPCEAMKYAAARFGTPLFIYSRELLEKQTDTYIRAFSGTDVLFCYAMKANSCRGLCEIIADKDFGADVVSGGELFRALRAGFPHNKIIFSGVGKTEEELEYAINEDILFINAESFEELKLIEKIAARLAKKIRFSVRINPDVDPHTHSYISTGRAGSKFGVSPDEAFAMYAYASKSEFLSAAAVHFHIGSQIASAEPFILAVKRMTAFLDRLAEFGISPEYADIGGGWGAAEGCEMSSPDGLRKAAEPLLARGKKLILEPGRSIAAPCGILLTKILYEKENGGKKYLITDGGMNDFLRPSLYGAKHPVALIKKDAGQAEPFIGGGADIISGQAFEVAGPICESGDYFAHDISMPESSGGDLIAILSAGAYGFSMSSNYNSRPRAAEVILENGKMRLLRRRETIQDIISLEL
ncbi:MAG: diaminopimelate decarboxylase [Elusimicrobiales bacterium]|nr:diaminopimelate decarboxylase [Elusimicrobiales bacterium]